MLLLFVKISNYLFLFTKIFISFLMVIVVYGYKDIRFFLKNTLYFYLVSMLLGGAIEFFDNQISYTNNGMVFYDNGLSGSYMVVLFFGLFLFFKYVRSFISLKNHYSYYHKCSIYFDKDNYVTCNAFLDTGNKLSVPYLNKSIVLVDKEIVDKLNVSNPIYVPYNSLNSHGILECYKCLKLEIDGKVFDKFLLGLSKEKFYLDGVDCIINNSVMEGLK